MMAIFFKEKNCTACEIKKIQGRLLPEKFIKFHSVTGSVLSGYFINLGAILGRIVAGISQNSR